MHTAKRRPGVPPTSGRESSLVASLSDLWKRIYSPMVQGAETWTLRIAVVTKPLSRLTA
jgi:hypothetical protein